MSGKPPRDSSKACPGHNQGGTLTLIKSTTGHVFGGFTSLAWARTGTGQYRLDSSAFIFTLTNPYGFPPTKFIPWAQNGSAAHAIYDGSLPTFGRGDDIRLDDKGQSYCNVSFSYGPDTSGRGNSLFTGAKNFQTAEVA